MPYVCSWGIGKAGLTCQVALLLHGAIHGDSAA